MRRRKKISGAADYIIPLAVVGLGFYVLNKFGLFGSGSGSGSSIPGGAYIPGTASSSPATQQQTLQIEDTIDNAAQALGSQNPLYVNIYNNNPGCVTISSDQATSLWNDIYTASDPGFFFSGKNADLSGVLASFQQTVQNQCDLSYVATLAVSNYGEDLWNFLRKFFFNDQTGTSGETNMQMSQDFWNWAVSLPLPAGSNPAPSASATYSSPTSLVGL
jgi:hypothetical protein